MLIDYTNFLIKIQVFLGCPNTVHNLGFLLFVGEYTNIGLVIPYITT